MTEIDRNQMREKLGNIEQIRDLLFGHKMEEYEQHFDNCDRQLSKLESQLAQFQFEIRARLAQIEDSFSKEIHSGLDALEKQLKYLSLNTQEETKTLEEKIDFIEQKLSHNLQAFSETFTLKNTIIKNELSQTKDKLEGEIQSLRFQVREEIEKSFSHLKEGKVSRSDLAELLFDLCLKIKGTDLANTELQQANDISNGQLIKHTVDEAQESNI